MPEGTLEQNMSEDKLVAAVRHLLQTHLSENINLKDDGTASISSVGTLYALQKEPRGKVTVYISTVFLKLGEIDTIKENFSANVFVQARWHEPSLDNYPQDVVDQIDWSKMWSPKLYIENLSEETKQTIWHKVTFDDQGLATVYEKRRMKGVFMESMELSHFPFDTQDLTVSVASELLERDVYLAEDRNDVSTLNRESFIDKQEWTLHSHVEVQRKTLTSNYSNIQRKPIISSTCRAKRRPGFFIWNIFLVMLFICSLAFATFSVSIALPQNRLQLSFTLVLTTIAFKFVASQSLPKISYLTLLDKYILTSMGILCSICVWHAIIPVLMVSQLSGKDNITLSQVTMIRYDTSGINSDDLQLTLDLDKYMAITLGCLYVLFHMVFFSIIIIQSHVKQSKYAKKDELHEERLEAIQKFTLESEDKKAAGSNKAKVAPLTEA